MNIFQINKFATTNYMQCARVSMTSYNSMLFKIEYYCQLIKKIVIKFNICFYIYIYNKASNINTNYYVLHNC